MSCYIFLKILVKVNFNAIYFCIVYSTVCFVLPTCIFFYNEVFVEDVGKSSLWYPTISLWFLVVDNVTYNGQKNIRCSNDNITMCTRKIHEIDCCQMIHKMKIFCHDYYGFVLIKDFNVKRDLHFFGKNNIFIECNISKYLRKISTLISLLKEIYNLEYYNILINDLSLMI